MVHAMIFGSVRLQEKYFLFPDTQAKKFLPVLHEVLKKMRGFNPRAFLIPIHVSMTFDYIKIMWI